MFPVHEPLTARTCLFCDAAADSREHVIPEWLSKRMAIRNEPFHPAIFNEAVGHKAYPSIKPESFRTRQVCTSCNNGWMSLLETEFQRRLGFLVEPEWPRLATDM